MKKNPKQIAAIAALVLIVILIAAFIISAFTADAGEAGKRFTALLYCIVALPILTWLLLFCIGKMQNKPAAEEFLPEAEKKTAEDS